ncbi:MAG: hypothetical protein AAF694_13965 [Bacteroidota bacterium]
MANTQVRTPSYHSRFLFAKNSYEKLVNAARDLSIFTQHGINAEFISELAHTCEEFQKRLENPASYEELAELEGRLIKGLEKIRSTAYKVWGNRSPKYQVYN